MENKASKDEKNVVYVVVAVAVVVGILGLMFIAHNVVKDWGLPGDTDKTTKVEQATVLDSDNEPGMELVHWDGATRVYYYRDKTTDTMFLKTAGSTSFVPMFCPGVSGQPLTYTQWCEMQEVKED